MRKLGLDGFVKGMLTSKRVALLAIAVVIALAPGTALAPARAESNSAAAAALERQSFQLREGDAANLYMRMQEQGVDDGLFEMTSRYKVVAVKSSAPQPGGKKYFIRFQVTDMRHSIITPSAVNRQLLIDVFSNIELRLNEDLRGEEVFNWGEIVARFEALKAKVGEQSKANALKLELIAAMYMQPEFWKATMNPVFDMQKGRWERRADKFYARVEYQVPGNALMQGGAKILGEREMTPVKLEAGRVTVHFKTVFDTSDMRKKFMDSPLGKALQSFKKPGEPDPVFNLTMQDEGVTLFNAADGWVEKTAGRLTVSSDIDGKKAKTRVVTTGFSQQRTPAW
ncbi:MAG: hypothetical protein NW215_04190 [Hyphomicrobiales bacterium]|nr:hypothetical protein [Hyphomicrobiales bacterium]